MIRILRTPTRRICALILAGSVWILAFGSPAAADETLAGHADLARELAEAVATGPTNDSLNAWSRSVIERALERAAGTAPLPGMSLHAPLLDDHTGPDGSKRSATAEVLLFTSLAVPAASWGASARDAARIGAPLVLRGVAEESLPATARRIADRLGEAQVGVAIDPRLFRLFGIARVPTVVVVPGGVPPCRSRGCADDSPPPFDRVSGNLSLAAALEAIAAEGDAGRAAARRHLATLRGME